MKQTNREGTARNQRDRAGRLTGLFLPYLLLGLTGTGAGHAQSACTPAPANMVAWWPADEDVHDVIGGSVSVPQNGAGYGPGVVGQAFRFDASNAKVRIPNNSFLRQTNRWTIEAWVRPASLGGALHPTIYSEGSRTVSLGLNSGAGKLECWLNGSEQYVSDGALTQDEWWHVALVRDGSDLAFYTNGVAAGSAMDAPRTLAGSGGAAIGHDTLDGPDTAFAGDIDELSLYDRALAADEILALYNAGSAGKCFSDDPAPVFVIEPEDQTAYLGEQVTLTALAMSSPRPSYQWMFNNSPLPGETNFTLVLNDIGFARTGNYAVVATSGTFSASSDPAALEVKFCTDTPSGLVAWWPGDGSGLDVTGEHHGQVWGGVTYPDGIAGKAFGFNGTDSYVAVPDSIDLSLHAEGPPPNEMSVEAWVNLPQLPQTDPFTGQKCRAVLSKGYAGHWEYSLLLTTAGLVEFYLLQPNGTASAYVSGGQMIPDQWHHLIVSLNKGQFLRLYQDTQLMAESTSFTGETVREATPLYIGRRSDGQFLDGRVDEVAIYNHALNDQEIAALYDGGRFGKCYSPTPAPAFAVQPLNAPGYLSLDPQMAALALGTPRPDYQWYVKGPVPADWEAISWATNATLTLTNVSPYQGGIYRVSAGNLYGTSTSDPVQLEVVSHELFTPDGESFEKGWNGWTGDNYAVWQVGLPTSGPRSAHDANNVAATVLAGNYPDDRTSRLVSPPFIVPPADQQPRLRFWHWWSFNCEDYGQVQVRGSDGTWASVSGTYWGDSFGRWSRAWLDLTAYAGQTVQLGFYFYSDDSPLSGCGPGADVGPGWYVDEVTVETGQPPTVEFPEGFERGWGGWTADYFGGRATEFGIWEIGRPTSGPGTPMLGPILRPRFWAAIIKMIELAVW